MLHNSKDSKAAIPAEVDEDVIAGQVDPCDDLRREFKPRHVSMIAIAGAIGTGLIIGSGTGLVRGGPASLFIAYCIIGAVVYFLMTALGEMATMLPMQKGFAGYATRFVDPALGYENQSLAVLVSVLMLKLTGTLPAGTTSSNMPFCCQTTLQPPASSFNIGGPISTLPYSSLLSLSSSSP